MSASRFMKACLVVGSAVLVACGTDLEAPLPEQEAPGAVDGVRAETVDCMLLEHHFMNPGACMPVEYFKQAAAEHCNRVGLWTGNYVFPQAQNQACGCTTGACYFGYSCCMEWK
ncbi:hypothetical protein HPC49_03255 [Pyxidicoccus fallax]|uniref:Lipoprotein n=1 Tax=Pyxidicoccus fallax TaxID=394095 RepID=A0A848LET4_9BACT|nr:hypothetical protein [Pyxidicoccus fallax]NMO15355.1 hypothetical protein [Pyxidicoccus fallax]NPC77275.1 hypothetical protein [Pyxidicoccus fallax]